MLQFIPFLFHIRLWLFRTSARLMSLAFFFFYLSFIDAAPPQQSLRLHVRAYTVRCIYRRVIALHILSLSAR